MTQAKQLSYSEFLALCENSPSIRNSSRVYLSDHDFRLYNTYKILGRYIKPHIKILSFGGGACFIEMALAQTFDVKIVSFDFRNSYLKNVESYEKYNIDFIEGNFLNDLKKIPEVYDFIIMSEFVEHIPLSLGQQLSMVKPFLKSGGTLFLSTPNFANLYNCLTMLIGKRNIVASDVLMFQNACASFQHVHRREYISSEIEAALIEQGFVIMSKSFCDGSSKKTFVMNLLRPLQFLFKRFLPFCLFVGKLN